MKRYAPYLLACSAVVISLPASAQTHSGGQVEIAAEKASDERLDRLRGGMDVGTDLHISFGLERLTTVNGALVASTQFQVRDIAHVTPSEALAAQHALGSLLTVSDGRATTTLLPAGNQSLATVIQNSLPNQDIKNVLTLNMATNSLGLLRASNANDQLRNLSLPGH